MVGVLTHGDTLIMVQNSENIEENTLYNEAGHSVRAEEEWAAAHSLRAAARGWQTPPNRLKTLFKQPPASCIP